MRGASFKGVWKDRRGYTLTEVLAAVAIAGVLAAISLIIFLALLECWRVEAAANQVAADMRLAHANVTHQLADWRVVLMHDGTPPADCSGGDPDDAVPRAVAGPSPRGPSSSIRTGR